MTDELPDIDMNKIRRSLQSAEAGERHQPVEDVRDSFPRDHIEPHGLVVAVDDIHIDLDLSNEAAIIRLAISANEARALARAIAAHRGKDASPLRIGLAITTQPNK